MEKDYRVNQRIRAPQVRVIGSAGEQLGILTLVQALTLARQQELDLVEVAPNADPPVCRILDYGKLRYLQTKKTREARKAQKFTELREVRVRPNISAHDLDSKVRKVIELLAEDGAKVKVSVFFRGRENTHPELGISVLKRVTDTVKELGRVEKAPAREGRALFIILSPLPGKESLKAKQDEGVADAKT